MTLERTYRAEYGSGGSALQAAVPSLGRGAIATPIGRPASA
jgi:hypothetical protein